MKRALYILSAALMVFASSCSKDEQPVRIDEVKMVSATINAESTEGQTKTTATKEGNVYKIKWVEKDQLSVFNSKNTEMSKFTSTVSGEAASSKFTGVIPEESEIVAAIYPYNAKATVSDDKKTVYTSVPAEQNGAFNNVVLAGWPKEAEEVNANADVYDFKYQFEAVCSIVKITVPETVSNERIVSIDFIAEKPITGDAKIVYPAEGKPVLIPNPDAKGSNIFNVINIAAEEGKTLKGEYYLAIFPISDEELNVTLKFTAQSGKEAYKHATLTQVQGKTGVFRANIVKNIGTVNNIVFPGPIEKFGLFSVNSNQQVEFAHGNLQYQASSKRWRFALNQWDAQGNLGNSTKPNSTTDEGARATQPEWIDLFRWGHSGCTINGRTYLPYDCTSSVLPGTSMTGDQNKYFDWGIQNAILNGDKIDPAGTWRLLTYAELNYMTAIGGPANYRKSTNNPANATQITATFKNYYGTEVTMSDDALFLRCKVSTGDALRYGIMIFPDHFTWPADIPVPYVANTSVTRLALNYKNIFEADAPVYTLTQFEKFEEQGVVFLPCAGYRNAFDPNKPEDFVVNYINIQGKYFTSENSQHLSFDVSNFSITTRITSAGWSVRLVKDVPVE